jgi:hypothetical protein
MIALCQSRNKDLLAGQVEVRGATLPKCPSIAVTTVFMEISPKHSSDLDGQRAGNGKRLNLRFVNQGLIIEKYQVPQTLLRQEVTAIIPGGIPGKVPGWVSPIFSMS